MNKRDFRAISIDPGGTSGIVIVKKQGRGLYLKVVQRKLTPLGLLRFLQKYGTKDVILICENFEFRPKSPPGLRMTSAHLIGIVMAYSEANKCRLFMQNAAYAKSGYFANDNALKAAKVFIQAMPHGMDAMRHFMQWFVFGAGFQYNDEPNVHLTKG